MARINHPRPGSVDYESMLPKVEWKRGIPNHIFQTDRSKDTKKIISANIQRIQQLNPGWTYALYDNEDIDRFILKEYGEQVYAYYKRIDSSYGAAKADFFRYLVIYRFGGVYLDIKSSVDKPLSEVFSKDDTYVLSFWDNLPGQKHEGFGHYPFLPEELERGEILQWYLAASAGHPLLRRIIITMLEKIDRYNPYIDGVGWVGTVATTGPVMYTWAIMEALKEAPSEYPVRWMDIVGEGGFRYSIFEDEPGAGRNEPVHVKVLSSDYRKLSVPLVRNRFRILQFINKKYLTLLGRRRAQKTERNDT